MSSLFFAWVSQHGFVLAVTATVSVILLLMTVLATPWLLSRLPVDYFSNERADSSGRGPVQMLVRLLRNVLGILLIALGFLMMITPGPGLVALILGLSVCDFPGKHRLLRRLVAHLSVFASLNWIRQRSASPPFLHPEQV